MRFVHYPFTFRNQCSFFQCINHDINLRVFAGQFSERTDCVAAVFLTLDMNSDCIYFLKPKQIADFDVFNFTC